MLPLRFITELLALKKNLTLYILNFQLGLNFVKAIGSPCNGPKGLPIILRLKNGDAVKPFKNGDEYSIIVMKEVHTLAFDDDSTDVLLKNEYQLWKSILIKSIRTDYFDQPS